MFDANFYTGLFQKLSIFNIHMISDIDECASDPCQHSGTCTDQVDGYICSCDSGYDGVHCQSGITIWSLKQLKWGVHAVIERK